MRAAQQEALKVELMGPSDETSNSYPCLLNVSDMRAMSILIMLDALIDSVIDGQ